MPVEEIGVKQEYGGWLGIPGVLRKRSSGG
jgi:hypothetical protein